MDVVSYSDLESVDGEFLPERIALSIISFSYVNNSTTTNEYPVQSGGGGGSGGSGGYQVMDACQANDSPASNSGLLGLFATPAQNSLQCIPAESSGGSS
jgi:hypothetical protein